MTGVETRIGYFLVQSRRFAGGYRGLVARPDDPHRHCVHATEIYRGRGAKDRAFQAARSWAMEHNASAENA